MKKQSWIKRHPFLIVIIGFFILAFLVDLFSEDNSLDSTKKLSLSLREEIVDNFSNIEQLHWAHMPLTYSVSDADDCEDWEIQEFIDAMKIIENSTNGIVSFVKVENESDLKFHCVVNEKKCENVSFDYNRDTVNWYDEGIVERNNETIYNVRKIWGSDTGSLWEVCYFFGVPKDSTIAEALPEIDGNIIIGGEITLYRNSRGARCSYLPNREIHEILHLFGIDHSVSDVYLNEFLDSLDRSVPPSVYGNWKEYNTLYDQYKEMGEDIMFQHSFCNWNTHLNEKYSSCLMEIYSDNYTGSCDEVNFLNFEGECPEGTYPSQDDLYCCPEPNMYIDIYGYCEYA